jgi:hypothetical protein
MDHPNDASKQEHAMSGCPQACSLSSAPNVLHMSRRKTATGQRASPLSTSGPKRPFNQMVDEDGRTISIQYGSL